MDCSGGEVFSEGQGECPEVRVASDGGPITVNSLDGIGEIDSGGGKIQVGRSSAVTIGVHSSFNFRKFHTVEREHFSFSNGTPCIIISSATLVCALLPPLLPLTPRSM